MRRVIVSFLAAALCLTAYAQDRMPVSQFIPVTGDTPLQGGIRQQPGFAGIFHKWGFIGDSLSSGEFEAWDADGTKHYYDEYEYSWGQRICAYTASQGDNYSQGGETARGWCEHFWDNPSNRNNNIDAKADLKQAYIIALGANDTKRPNVGDIHTDVNLSDYHLNGDTFAGWYAGIIQRVKSLQPGAKFFVVTLPEEWGVVPQLNEVIRSMPELFTDIYVLDIQKYAPNYGSKEIRDHYYLGGHLNPAGYEMTAWMFMNYIDWYIRNYPREFAEVGFIGSDRCTIPHEFWTKFPAKPSSITDKKELYRQYRLNASEWRAALEFLKRDDLASLNPGKYQLTPRGTYANVQVLKTVKERKALKKGGRFENHRKYVDIQYVLDGKELILLSGLDQMGKRLEEYSAENDVEFFAGDDFTPVEMNDTTYVIAFPGEPHIPGIAPDKKPAEIKKVVVKVLYSE